ncbi:MAG TPA: hypothetical protein VFG04_04780 [Planctomycetaceae bacterium]|jgi:hypothetical protein|nr:hypothetical protein [Planctomycetaceae bacterium]
MKPVPVFAAVVVALVVGFMPHGAVAQTRAFNKAPGKVEMRIKSAHPEMRSGAPFSLELEFESTFQDVVIEGPLELTFVDDDRIELRVVSTPIALPPDSKTSLRVSLPSLACLRTQTEFKVRVVLNATRRTFNLGTHDLLVPLKGMRQFVIAAPGLNEVHTGELARHLPLDEFRPKNLSRQNFATFLVELDAHLIQGDPIALYPYDVIVLAGQHFSSLSARQLETLATWTESGGGIVVVPTGALSEAHIAFLAKLIGRERADFETDALGRLPQWESGHADWLSATRYGFGRSLILRSPPPFVPKGSLPVAIRDEWIRAVTFLWNVRSEQIDKIVAGGTWVMPAPVSPVRPSRPLNGTSRAPKISAPNGVFATRDLTYTLYGDPGSLKSEEPAAADALRDLLFPATVRVVPFGVVLGILVSFLVVVAPADYVILGWLRRRRYTWIVFPCVSLLFTALTVSVAGYYSGNTDHRGALVIVDVGHAGRALRTSRLVHVITADTHTLTADIRDGLFAKTEMQPAQTTSLTQPPTDPIDELPVRSEDDTTYEGLLPSAFTVTWLSRQWSPAMHRQTQAGSDIEIPKINWAALDRLDLGTESGRFAAINSLRSALPQCALLFANGKQEVEIPFPATVSEGVDHFDQWGKVMASLGRRRDRSLLAILFGVSPNGAGDLEDLAALDDAETQTWLVHAATVRDKELIVFRHVVRKSAAQGALPPKGSAGKLYK